VCIQRRIDESDAGFAGLETLAVDEGDDRGPDGGGEGCAWEVGGVVSGGLEVDVGVPGSGRQD